MSHKKNAVVINAFPINKQKSDMLENNVNNFKKMGYTVVVISGCDIPIHIQQNIDYYIINRENLVLGKEYVRKCYEMVRGINICSLVFSVGDKYIRIFTDNHNPTIARNTRLVFEFLKSVGIDNVLYTEDDNVFHMSSHEVIERNLTLLNDGTHKMITGKTTMDSSNNPMLFSCLFFANVEFFLKHFKIPTTIEEWKNEENIINLKLYRAYEESLYMCFKDVLDDVKNFLDEFNFLVKENAASLNLCSRYDSLKWRAEHGNCILEDPVDGKLYFVAYNLCSSVQKNTDLKLVVTVNGHVFKDIKMVKSEWFWFEMIDRNAIVKIKVNDEYEKTIHVSDIEAIRNSGIIISV